MTRTSDDKPVGFFSLPRELRDCIYELALYPFECTTTIGVDQPHCAHFPERQTLPRVFLKTQMVSKSFSAESQAMFYKHATMTQLVALQDTYEPTSAGPDILVNPVEPGAPTTIALPNRPDLCLIQKLDLTILISTCSGDSCLLCTYRQYNRFASADRFHNESASAMSSVDDYDDEHGSSEDNTNQLTSGFLVESTGLAHTLPSLYVVPATTTPIDGQMNEPQSGLIAGLKMLGIRFMTEHQKIREYAIRIGRLRGLVQSYQRALLPQSILESPQSSVRQHHSLTRQPTLTINAHVGFSTRNDDAGVFFRRGWTRRDIAIGIGRPLVWQVDLPHALNGKPQKWLGEGKTHREMMTLADELEEQLARDGQAGLIGERTGRVPERLWTEMTEERRDRGWEVIAMEAWGGRKLEELVGGEALLREMMDRDVDQMTET